MTDYLSAQQVADRLNLSIRTIRSHIKSGKLKSVKVGRLRRVAEEDLEAFIGRRDQRKEIETYILKQQNKLMREAAEALAEWQSKKKKSWIEEHRKTNPVLSMGSRGMWLLPKQIISAFAPVMEDWTWPSSRWCQLSAPLLMWRSKHSPSRTWSQRWKRENWIKHLCGRTLKRSQRNNFTDWWTSSLAAIRVNRSVPQESETPKTQEDSGRFYAEQFKLFSPDEYSSRTSKDTSRLDSPALSATWKKMVTEQRGEYSARLKSEQVTKERESSSTENWPTPDASVEKFRLGGNSQQSKSLEAMGRRGELSQQDPENRNSTGKNQERLSPNWTEQLMGVPVGWTQLPTEWTDSGCWEMG